MGLIFFKSPKLEKCFLRFPLSVPSAGFRLRNPWMCFGDIIVPQDLISGMSYYIGGQCTVFVYLKVTLKPFTVGLLLTGCYCVMMSHRPTFAAWTKTL